MRRQIGIWVASAILAASPSLLVAQVEKGDKEVQVQAFVVSGGGSTFATVGGLLGVYITRKLQIRGGSNLNIGSGSTDGSLQAGFTYNFATEGAKSFPYLAAEYFLASVKNPSGSSAAYPSVGLKTFLHRGVALDYNAGYAFSLSGGGGGIFVGRFGLSLLFR